jgi:hypothetical protein
MPPPSPGWSQDMRSANGAREPGKFFCVQEERRQVVCSWWLLLQSCPSLLLRQTHQVTGDPLPIPLAQCDEFDLPGFLVIWCDVSDTCTEYTSQPFSSFANIITSCKLIIKNIVLNRSFYYQYTARRTTDTLLMKGPPSGHYERIEAGGCKGTFVKK